MVGFSSLLLLLPSFLLLGAVNADCTTFKQVDYLGYLTASTKTYNKTGVYLQNQIQQVSPAVTCNGGSAHHYNIGCGPHTCAVKAAGNGYAHARTNLTLATEAEKQANAGILNLALQQVDWHKLDRDLDHSVDVFGNVAGGELCLTKGQSGYMEFVPTFDCVTGVLEGCSGTGVPFERNGQGVTVCMPGSATGTTNNVVLPQGNLATKTVSTKEASKRRANPALKLTGASSQSARATWAKTIASACVVAGIMLAL